MASRELTTPTDVQELVLRPVKGQKISAYPSGAKVDRVAVNDAKTKGAIYVAGTFVAPTPPPPVLAYRSTITGGIIKGKTAWFAEVTSGEASKVEFYIDGQLRWTEQGPPYGFNGDETGGILDTATLSEGQHNLSVLAYDKAGKPGADGFAGGVVTVDNVSDTIPDPTPNPDPTPGPSGVPMPDTAPAGWKRLYGQEFNTDVAEGKWPQGYAPHMGAYPDGWKDTSKNGYYAPRIISCHDSMMDVHVRTENGVHLVSVPTVTPNGQSDYPSGRYTIRFKIDSMKGYKTAWLLWPKSNTWPRDGEIDFPERNLDSSRVDGFMHRQGASSGGDQYNANRPFDLTKWHTCTIEWIGGKSCEFFLDGVSIGKTTDRVPNTPMHWVIQTETALDGTVPANAVQGHVYVDWLTMDIPA